MKVGPVEGGKCDEEKCKARAAIRVVVGCDGGQDLCEAHARQLVRELQRALAET